jgi:hypothetical protein
MSSKCHKWSRIDCDDSADEVEGFHRCDWHRGLRRLGKLPPARARTPWSKHMFKPFAAGKPVTIDAPRARSRTR